MASELVADLKKLAELHKTGVLSSAEFAAAKEGLLSRHENDARRDDVTSTHDPVLPTPGSSHPAKVGEEPRPAAAPPLPPSADAAADLRSSQLRDFLHSTPRGLRIVATVGIASLLLGGIFLATSALTEQREAALAEEQRQQREQEQEILEFLAADLTFRCEWRSPGISRGAPDYFSAQTESAKVQALLRGASASNRPLTDAELDAARPGTAFFQVLANICGGDRQLAADILDWERRRRG